MPRVYIMPSQAAWVDENATSENHGIGISGTTDKYLWLRSEDSKNRRIYMQYDFTSSGDVVNDVALPTTASTIIRAAQSLRCFDTTGLTTGNTIDTAREATSAWNSSTITWSTAGGGAGQPAKSTTRGAKAYGAVSGAPVSLDSTGLRDVVQGWVDKTLTNNGCYLIPTVEGSTVGYGWRFLNYLIAPISLDNFKFPPLIVDYRDVDTLPATATDDEKQFVGAALTALNRSHITDYSFTLTLELADGDLVVTEDVVAFSRIERKLPFLLENKLDLGRATFQLFNENGEYSPNRRSSKLYARRAIGRNMKLELTVADQTVTLFSGEIQTVDTLSDGRVEIMGEQQPVERQFAEILSQENLSSVLTIFNANPADAIYEILKQAGIADTDINLATFIDAKASWATSGMTVGTLWADKTAAEMIGYVLEASLSSMYFDWKGRYALHYWQPHEPSVTELTDHASYEWGENFRKIRNYVQVEYNADLNTPTRYMDGESQADWKVRELKIQNPLLAVPGRASAVAVMYTQALADPIGMGTVTGDIRLLQFDLTRGVTLTDTENEIDEDCIVTGISFDPVNRSATLSIMKANWPLPRRDFVNDADLTWGDPLGDEDYAGANTLPLNDPTPSAFSFAQANDGSVAAVIQWTQTTGAARADGYVAYCNHSTTSGQVIPSTAAADEVYDIPVATALISQTAGLALFTMPQDHYAAFAVQTYRNRSEAELYVGQSDRQYTGLITSSSAPDWQDRRYDSVAGFGGDLRRKDSTGGSTDILIDETSGLITEHLSVRTQSSLPPITVANKQAVITVAGGIPLLRSSASTDRPFSTIYIATHNVTIGETTATYNSDALTCSTGTYGVKYYIYTDDPTWSGGAVTYNKTTVYKTLLENSGRYYLGHVTNPTSQGAGGTTGSGGGIPPAE